MRHALMLAAATLGIAAGALIAAETPPAVRTLQVHPGLPPLAIRILPAPEPASAGTSHLIGRVEISHPGEAKPFQTLEVTGDGSAQQLAAFSRFEDVSFDGYTDLLLANGGGAKWMGYEVFVFDPASGSFVQNELSREMSRQLGGQNLELHRAEKEIVVTHMAFGCQNGFVQSETFAVRGSSLRKVEQQDDLRTPQGCYAVKRRSRDAGSLEEISRQRVPELDRTSG
jgi:hypothetical protein